MLRLVKSSLEVVFVNSRKNTGTNAKPQNAKYVLRRLWDYLFHYRLLLAIAIILSIASSFFALIGPYLAGQAIDAIDLGVGNVYFDKVFKYAILMIIFYLCSAILSFTLQILMIKIGQKITKKMREDVFNHLVYLPVNYFDTNQIGDILSRMSYDIDTINTSLSSDLIVICSSVITVIGSLIMMLYTAPLLVLVFLITIPLSIAFTRFAAKKARPLYRMRSKKLGELNGFVEEKFSGYKTIKAYGREDVVLAQFDEVNKEACHASYMAEYWAISGPGVNFMNNISLSFISVFGTILYIIGYMTVGQIASFVTYSRKFSGPINEAANLVSELQSACAAAERVFRLLDEPVEKLDSDDAISLNDVSGKVDLKEVSFGYVKDKIIIHNLNLDVLPGQTIAIVGKTGAGKTTLINLLMRFYDVNSGDIFIDDKSIYSLTRKSLRNSYAMVLQDTWLFNGSIYDNISYGCINPTKENVIKAAKSAHIHNYIMSLPEEYDTIISDDGINISKGQKQLMTIARAMMSNSKMLIFDEATSNVDSLTEIEIQRAMLELMKDKTCFIIAHRLSTIKDADLILVVDNGEIVEKGTHQDLLNKNGYYASLFNSQFS